MPEEITIVGVLFGGESGEHFVSVNSARTVLEALSKGANANRFKALPFYIDQDGSWWPPEVALKVLKNGVPKKKEELHLPTNTKKFKSLPEGSEQVEVWFPVLHGPNGEDGTVQGVFTLMGKPFVGSGVLGSSLGMDKLAMKAAFSAIGLNQVPYLAVNASHLQDNSLLQNIINRSEEQLKYPCFIKPANLGSSVGISKAKNRLELLDGLINASKLDRRIILEKAVLAREFECAVLGMHKPRTSVVGEIIFNADWYDYETKYSADSSQMVIPAKIPPQIIKKMQEMSITAFQAIAAQGLARVDFFYNEIEDFILINEINTLPGFTRQSMYPKLWEASGLNLQNLVAKLVDLAAE